MTWEIENLIRQINHPRLTLKNYLGCGRNRAAFLLKNHVVKVPIRKYGETDNIHEAKIYEKHGKTGIYARCRLIQINNLPCLMMERVHPKAFDYFRHTTTETQWILSIDCQQVGFNRKNKLVAYDYGWS